NPALQQTGGARSVFATRSSPRPPGRGAGACGLVVLLESGGDDAATTTWGFAVFGSGPFSLRLPLLGGLLLRGGGHRPQRGQWPADPRGPRRGQHLRGEGPTGPRSGRDPDGRGRGVRDRAVLRQR